MIEGLFLSSAVQQSPDFTMERLLDTIKKLRIKYRFNGYIHVKGIPSADENLIRQAGEYADRMSFNIELPSEKSLKLLAPQKSKNGILLPMKNTALEYMEAKRLKSNNFLPAGQTTQMIVGASPETDGQIVRLAQGLFKKSLLLLLRSDELYELKPARIADRTASGTQTLSGGLASAFLRFYRRRDIRRKRKPRRGVRSEMRLGVKTPRIFPRGSERRAARNSHTRSRHRI